MDCCWLMSGQVVLSATNSSIDLWTVSNAWLARRELLAPDCAVKTFKIAPDGFQGLTFVINLRGGSNSTTAS